MRKLLNYIPTVLVAALIAYLSLLREPHFQLPPVHISHLDKWLHLLMYLLFSAILTFDHVRACQRLSFLICSLIPVFYGGLMEILQEYFFYPRAGEWLDWFADIIGSMLGFAFAAVVLHLRKKI